MDTTAAVGIIVSGYGIGYGAIALNQYPTVVAQKVAALSTYSGIEVRLGIMISFVMVGAQYIYSNSKKVQLNRAFSKSHT